MRETSPQVKEKLAAALITHNPRLERFSFDYSKIAESLRITEPEARARYTHIELNPAEGDLAVQLTVYGDHVDIAIPYWYIGADADRVFSQISEYLRIIRRTAGFFVYDPQTGIAFDPEQSVFQDHLEYDKVVKDLPNIAALAGKTRTKPWWKFW